MIRIAKKVQSVQPALRRHLFGRNSRPYERILQHIRTQDDIWVTTQGDYIDWWREREAMQFTVRVEQGLCHLHTSSPSAIVEHFHAESDEREFLNRDRVPCPQSDYTGEIRLTIDRAIKHQAFLVELLRREGILNFQVGSEGDFFLSAAELDPLLEPAYARLIERKDQPAEQDVAAIREQVRAKLASRGVPLLRIWYHPRVNGRVPMAVFSPRYDVDRAISNMRSIRSLEQKYGVESTLYIRAFCPFYSDAAVTDLSAQPWCPELALHGEFVTNGRVYGGEHGAAIAERAHLEQITRRSIAGAGMHGGELTNNLTGATSEALAGAAIGYDTTPRPRPGNYLPYRRIIDGKFSNVFGLAHALSDINIEATGSYGERFYQETVTTMRQIRTANGVFVLMLHPEYFGFFSYLSKPSNLAALARYMTNYLSGRGQGQAAPHPIMAAKELAIE